MPPSSTPCCGGRTEDLLADCRTGWAGAHLSDAVAIGLSHWDADALRDVVQAYAVGALGDAHGVFAVGETRFLKRGKRLVWLTRQHSGTLCDLRPARWVSSPMTSLKTLRVAWLILRGRISASE
ncbi:transposase [Rhizobium tibeticum]|uniref:transposase n=1 Tax=Rhizobium tibeticum TaxID=501024 RepID=UPI0027D7B570|nr:transposase [Rhizobium tibeticum]